MTLHTPPTKTPLVTIGISTFNRATSTFPETLESALSQTYGNTEVVVCDNASTDGTVELVHQQRSARLRYHRHPVNIGANANFNACLELARGQYFILLHDDDLLDLTFVERAMTELNGQRPGIFLSGVRIIDAQGRLLRKIPPPPSGLTPADLFLHWFDRKFSFYLVTTIFQTDALRKAGGFSSPESLFQDVVAIARLAARRGYASVPGLGGSFRQHVGSRTSKNRAMSWAHDAAYLLDVLCEELPAQSQALRHAGSPYLAATSYRHATKEPSWLLRWSIYRDVYILFGRSLAPWRYFLDRHNQKLQRGLRKAVRTVSPRRFQTGNKL